MQAYSIAADGTAGSKFPPLWNPVHYHIRKAPPLAISKALCSL
jgi:hypothetical protein